MPIRPLSKQLNLHLHTFHLTLRGGRCEECKGDGTITIEMQFMADIKLECESCHGKRFSSEVLEVEYEGQNIHDILEMTVTEGIRVFRLQERNY